jgi:hypothetical protein
MLLDKIKDRTLCGSSHELNGCVLDDPHPDPNDPILHRVYCADTQRVYMLTRRIYEERIKEIDQKRPNDCFKIEDARLYFGKYIKFTIGERNSIVDFVLGTDKEDALFEDGRNVFKSKCVFNKDHTECKTEHFNVISLNPEDILVSFCK